MVPRAPWGIVLLILLGLYLSVDANSKDESDSAAVAFTELASVEAGGDLSGVKTQFVTSEPAESDVNSTAELDSNTTVIIIRDPALNSSVGRVYELQSEKEFLRLMEDSRDKPYAYFVNFYADWCVFSKAMRPAYAYIAQRFPELGVLQLNAYRHHDLNSIGIYGFPTVLLFYRGKIQGKVEGPRTCANMIALLTRKIKFYENITFVDEECPFDADAQFDIFENRLPLYGCIIILCLLLVYNICERRYPRGDN